jgi:G3E family GTPase
MKIDYIAEAITEAFGERCPEFAEGCACCEAWKQYDGLLSDIRTADEQAEKLESLLEPHVKWEDQSSSPRNIASS